MLTDGGCVGKAAAVGGKAGAPEGIFSAREGVADGVSDEELRWDVGCDKAACEIGGAIISNGTGMTKSAAAAICIFSQRAKENRRGS
jgi:hypothetical protein